MLAMIYIAFSVLVSAFVYNMHAMHFSWMVVAKWFARPSSHGHHLHERPLQAVNSWALLLTSSSQIERVKCGPSAWRIVLVATEPGHLPATDPSQALLRISLITFLVFAPPHPNRLTGQFPSLGQAEQREERGVTNYTHRSALIQSPVDSTKIIQYVSGLDPSAVSLTRINPALVTCVSVTSAPNLTVPDISFTISLSFNLRFCPVSTHDS